MGVTCAMRHRAKLPRPFVLEESSLESTVSIFQTIKENNQLRFVKRAERNSNIC
jgi:hypothetical protein